MNTSVAGVVAGMSFLMLMTGYMSAQLSSAKRSALSALVFFAGMFFIITAYRHLGGIYYPEHKEIFAAMDSKILGVSFIFFLVWMMGISLCGMLERRRTKERELYKKAYPNVEFKEGESIRDSLRKYVES